MKGDRVECIINFLSITNLFQTCFSIKQFWFRFIISAFTGKQRSKLKVPLTIIPSNLKEEEIDKLS